MSQSSSESKAVKATSAMVWAMPEQAEVLIPILKDSGITVTGAGCPDSTKSGAVAKSFGCDVQDDLRHLLSTETPDLVLLASTTGFADQDSELDLAALEQAHSREMAVATLEPLPTRPGVMTGTAWMDTNHARLSTELAAVVPMIRQTGLIDELMATLESFGAIRSMSVSLSAPASFGSLGARIFEAMDLVRTLVGVPQTIDASFQSAHRVGVTNGIHPLPGQSLRNLEGILAAHLRMPDGRGIVMQVTDQVGQSVLRLSILGSEGQILVTDDGFERFDTSGNLIDTFRLSTSNHQDSSIIDPSAIRLCEQLIQLCSGVGPVRAPVDHPSVFAMGHAALLSARTGQGETPSTIRRLLMEA